MSTTASQAYAVIKARLEANRPTDAGSNRVRLFWQNQDQDSDGQGGLPDTPTPFVYTEFLTSPGELVGFGGGRNSNLYRNPGRIEAYVFIPKGQGLQPATDIAEQIAALFRSYRDTNISCLDATVYPGGDGASFKPATLNSDVGNYFVAVTEISLFFDLIG